MVKSTKSSCCFKLGNKTKAPLVGNCVASNSKAKLHNAINRKFKRK